MKAKLNSLNRSFLLLLIALLVCSNLYSQYDICFTTPGNGSTGIVPGGLENISNVDGPYYIRIYTHIVRTSNGTGGQISCIGATIKNCPIGVEFAPYQNFWPFSLPTGQQGQPRNYVGSFTSTSFLTNDDYPHSQPFHSFVHMTGVNGIRLYDCSYINIRAIQGSSLADWGYGIFANDAGFSVTSQCSEPPCRTEGEIDIVKTDFYGKRNAYLLVKADYALNPTEEKARQMAYYQRAMDEAAYMVAIHELYDTAGFSADTLRTWISNMGSLEGDLWLADELLGMGNATAAIAKPNAAITTYQLTGESQTDMDNYKSIVNVLDGKPFYSLDGASLQSINGYLDADGYAEGWAKSILTLYGGHFPAEYIKDGGSIEERSMEVGGSPDMAHQPEWVRASPNPARDLVNFSVSLPEGVKEAALRIFDVNGRQVHAQSGLAQAGSYIWQTGAHPSGVYFYHLTADGKVLRSGKIILNK